MQLNFSSSVQAAAVALLSYYITAKRLTHSNFTHFFHAKMSDEILLRQKIYSFHTAANHALKYRDTRVKAREKWHLVLKKKIKNVQVSLKWLAIMHTKNHDFKQHLCS